MSTKEPEAPSRNSADGRSEPSGAGDARSNRARRRLPNWVRLSIPPAILVVGGAILATCWNMFSGDATWQVMSVWYVGPAIPFLLLLWWLFLSDFGWRTRLTVVAVLAAGVGAFFAAYRVKDFTGDMVPRFESRWQPTAEDRAATYWTSLESETEADKGAGSAPAPSQALSIGPGDWAEFDGPQRDGIARGVRIRTDWDRDPPRKLWRHPVGAGWSSFAVVGRYAYTQEQRGKDEVVACYDADTGHPIWVHSDRGVRFDSAMGGLGPRATPTIAGSRVYTFGATGMLNCLDPHTGSVVWSTDAVRDAGVPPLQFGMSGSPLVYDNVVVVNAGGTRKSNAASGGNDRALTAYDRNAGKIVWCAGNHLAGYASPILATIEGVRQIILFDGVGVAGHDAATGKELWRSPDWTNLYYNNIAQPIVQPDGSIFVSSGYGTGCILLDVKKANSEWAANPRWTARNQFKLKFNSGVYRDGCVYGLDEGILACFDLSTGKSRWKKGRYKYGQVLLVDNVLLVVSEDGDVAAVEISPGGGTEIARFHAIDGKTWNEPAISRGRLYVRNAEEAACYDLGPVLTASTSASAPALRRP